MRREFVGLALVLGGALAASSAGAQGTAEPRPSVFVLTLAPEWGYRSFVDIEPSSTDKHYSAWGIFGLRLHAEFYPLAALRTPMSDVWRNFGVIGTYARAFGLSSTDNDRTQPQIVDTEWHHDQVGIRYRALGGTGPLALGFSAAFERWVFDFDAPSPPRRLVPTARYSLLPVGVDARWSLGRVAFFGDARFLLPLSKAPLGDRAPSPGGFGIHAGVGVAVAPVPALELDVRAAYTMMRFSLPSLPGRADEPGTVFDQYLVFSAGATVQF